MKIGFVDLAGPDFPGGCEKYYCSLANYISKNNTTYFFHSREYVNVMEWIYFILIRYKFNKISFISRTLGRTRVFNIPLTVLIPFTKTYLRMKRLMRECDSIYVKNEFQDLLLSYFLLGDKDYQSKVVIGVHSAIFIPSSVSGVWKILHDIQYNSWIYKTLLRKAKDIHVPNTAYKQKLLTKLNTKHKKISIVYHPIDWKPTFNPSKQTNSFTIIWLGRLTQQKGVKYLEEIINQISTKAYFSELKFYIAGEGEKEDSIRLLQKNYDNVHYLGFVKNTKKLYTNADLAIVTSYFEVFPYSVLEPQSFGLPIVCAPVDGTKDIISSESGIIANNTEKFIMGIESYVFKKKTSLKDYNVLRKEIYTEKNKKFDKLKIYRKLEEMLSR